MNLRSRAPFVSPSPTVDYAGKQASAVGETGIFGTTQETWISKKHHGEGIPWPLLTAEEPKAGRIIRLNLSSPRQTVMLLDVNPFPRVLCRS